MSTKDEHNQYAFLSHDPSRLGSSSGQGLNCILYVFCSLILSRLVQNEKDDDDSILLFFFPSAIFCFLLSFHTALVATAGGSMYGIIKAQPASLYAFQSGANTFVFAFPFFGEMTILSVSYRTLFT